MIYCECNRPDAMRDNRDCKLCGRKVVRPPTVSLQLFQRELNQMMGNQLDHMRRFPLSKSPRPSVRQRVARRIKETRRRLRNAQAALKGAWETDYDY
jgi:hypothetical protein